MIPFGTYQLGLVPSFGILLGRHMFLGRGTSRRLLERYVLGQRHRPIDAAIWGGRVKLRLPVTSSIKYVISDWRYNERERHYLRSIMRANDVVVDIGANVGFYTLWLAATGAPGTRILAFEPNPSVYEALVENVRLNGFTHVTTVQAAVGGANEPVSFGIVPERPGLGSVLKTDATQVMVRMVTLAQALEDAGLERCDVVKIDVEGYEYEALAPYFETAPEAAWPRVLLVEKNTESRHWAKDLVGFLIDRGYRVALQTPGNLALERTSAA